MTDLPFSNIMNSLRPLPSWCDPCAMILLQHLWRPPPPLLFPFLPFWSQMLPLPFQSQLPRPQGKSAGTPCRVWESSTRQHNCILASLQLRGKPRSLRNCGHLPVYGSSQPRISYWRWVWRISLQGYKCILTQTGIELTRSSSESIFINILPLINT